MLHPKIAFYLPLFLSSVVILISIWKWKKLDIPGKLVSIDQSFSSLIGLISYNYPVHNKVTFAILQGYNLIDFLLLCLFFNYSISRFRKKNIAICIAIAGFIIWIACIFFFRNIRWASSSRFESFHSLSAIILSLIAIYFMLMDFEWRVLFRNPIFWFTVSILFIFSTTFIFTIMFEIIARDQALFWKIELYTMVITCLDYLILGFAFLLYPKKNSAIA